MSNYPNFHGLQFGFCRLSAGAEFDISPSVSVLPSVNVIAKSFAGEIRGYFPGRRVQCQHILLDNGRLVNSYSNQGFVSARLSTRGNLGIGIGMRTDENIPFLVTPSFGISYNIESGECKPFISLGFYF